MNHISFVTFGTRGKYPQSLSRIEKEARSLGVFRDVFVWDESDIDAEFTRKHLAFMKATRGFGYYMWKPYIILKALSQMPEGSVVVYADAGCTLHAKGLPRLMDYISLAKASPMGLCGFHLTHLEKSFNKIDTAMAVFPYASMYSLDHILNTPQRVGCTHIWHNTAAARAFVEEWMSLCIADGYKYVSDVPSILPNHPDFQEHRHDQAIYSLLTKKYETVVTIIPDETWHPQWDSFAWPIHAVRLRC